jgi:hypothetical protein
MNYPIFKKMGFAFYKLLSDADHIEVYPKDKLNKPCVLHEASEQWNKRVIERGVSITENAFIDAYVKALHDIHLLVNPDGLQIHDHQLSPELENY